MDHFIRLLVAQPPTHPSMIAIGAFQSLPVSNPDCLVAFEAPMPQPGPLDVIVRIHAIAVNPVDTKIRANLGTGRLDSPRILGWDAAGTIESVGSEVTRFQPGDEVFYAGDITRQGCNAEYQAVDSRLIAHKPHDWSFSEAAALPLVTLTAWELLLERMGVNPSEEDAERAILIINGAGGVGSAMIPLARLLGLKVVATASRPETVAWCKQLGAHEVVNHHQALRPQLEAIGHREFPYIANLSNTEQYWDATADLIAPMGALGLIVEPKHPLSIGDPLKAKCVRICWEFMAARAKFRTPDMHRQGEILEDVADLCQQGLFPKIHTRVLDGLTVDNLIHAHSAMEQATAHGKWVMQVKA